MKKHHKRHSARNYASYAIPLGIIVLGVFLFSQTLRGKVAVNQIYDTIRTTDSRNEVAIIAIDDKSLRELGAWPWDRKLFAQLTDALGKQNVKLAAFDILFLEPRMGDDAFAESLKNASFPILLASKSEQNTTVDSFLIGKSANVYPGETNVYPDTDGKVRSYPPLHLTDSICTGFLAYEAYKLEHLHNGLPCVQGGYFFRYSDKVATYSLVDVLRGDIPDGALSGKTVFIGSTSLGLEDHFVGRTGAKVPGVYIHASLFTSLLSGIQDREVPRLASGALFVLYAGLSVLLLFTTSSLLAQVAAIVALLLTLPILAVALFDAGYIVPLPWLLLTVIVSSGYTLIVRFVLERKQNEEIRNMFSKYVHKDVLEDLISQGGVKLGGEKKELTVLFSDIRGFTTLSESLSPEELTSVLNGYLSAMTPHILEERGTIDKFIGDAIMAFWNAPLSVRNHEHHAVKAALRMRDELVAFNENHGTNLAAGIGLHAGQAVVGNVGGQDRVNYTILGDTVNLASRLEGLTKKYGITILTTESVKNKVEDDALEWRRLDSITVVGKSIPVDIYEVRRKGEYGLHTVETYEEAHALYAKGEWNKAEELFGKLAQEGDHPSEKMLARIPELRKRTDWDGIWRFDEK
jgi:adenylate cyclase